MGSPRSRTKVSAFVMLASRRHRRARCVAHLARNRAHLIARLPEVRCDLVLIVVIGGMGSITGGAGSVDPPDLARRFLCFDDCACRCTRSALIVVMIVRRRVCSAPRAGTRAAWKWLAGTAREPRPKATRAMTAVLETKQLSPVVRGLKAVDDFSLTGLATLGLCCPDRSPTAPAQDDGVQIS